MDECTSKTSKQSSEIKFKYTMLFFFLEYTVWVIDVCAALVLV